MATDLTLVPISDPIPVRNGRHATVEQVEDYETPTESTSPTSPTTPTTLTTASSKSSLYSQPEGDDSVEEIPRLAPLCRRDLAHELATSLWGLVPPKNFGCVLRGSRIYRSGFPQKENLSFLRTLGLKTILTLVTEEYTASHQAFVQENNVNHIRIPVAANKDPKIFNPQTALIAALAVVLDRSNHPILVHCNKGKHRTGCVVGCLRKIMGWNFGKDVLAEYRRYAGEKARILDEKWMDLFDERSLLWLARSNNFIPMDEPINDSPVCSFALTTSARLKG